MSQVTHWAPRRASAAIAAHRIVTAAGAVANSAATQGIGVSGSRAVAAGETVEVAIAGIAPIEYGGNVAAGDLLRADATEKAVVTNTAGHRIIGIAMVAGVDGDIGEVLLSPGSV